MSEFYFLISKTQRFLDRIPISLDISAILNRVVIKLSKTAQALRHVL